MASLVCHDCYKHPVHQVKQRCVIVLHLSDKTSNTMHSVPVFVDSVKDETSPSVSLALTKQSLHSCACMTCSWYFRQLATPPGQFNNPLNVAACSLWTFTYQAGSTSAIFNYIFLRSVTLSLCNRVPPQHFCVKSSVYNRPVVVTINAERTCAFKQKQHTELTLIGFSQFRYVKQKSISFKIKKSCIFLH